jgi:hypothetical protein
MGNGQGGLLQEEAPSPSRSGRKAGSAPGSLPETLFDHHPALEGVYEIRGTNRLVKGRV